MFIILLLYKFKVSQIPLMLNEFISLIQKFKKKVFIII